MAVKSNIGVSTKVNVSTAARNQRLSMGRPMAKRENGYVSAVVASLKLDLRRLKIPLSSGRAGVPVMMNRPITIQILEWINFRCILIAPVLNVLNQAGKYGFVAGFMFFYLSNICSTKSANALKLVLDNLGNERYQTTQKNLCAFHRSKTIGKGGIGWTDKNDETKF